jgi:flagellar biosynthesis protein FliR
LTAIANALNQLDVVGLFLVFCRVGTAFVLLPGFSFARVPMFVRAMLALVVSASAYPFLKVSFLNQAFTPQMLGAIFNELFMGLFFGFLCALFVYAVRFFAHFVMALVGLAGIPGQAVDDVEPNPAFVMIFSMAFTALIFATDLHLVSFRALLETYQSYPIGTSLSLGLVTESFITVLRDTSLMALQASSPFIVYAIAINFALGLVGKLTPQLQAYFALMGMSILVAFLGLSIIGSPILSFMVTHYAMWLETGL